MNIWRRFVRGLCLISMGFLLIASFGFFIWGYISERSYMCIIGLVGGCISFGGWLSCLFYEISLIKILNNWVKAAPKQFPLKPPLDKQALYEAIMKHGGNKEKKIGEMYIIGCYLNKAREKTYYCKIKYWLGWKTIYFQEYVNRPGPIVSVTSEKKYNDQLVHLLELLIWEDSMGNPESKTISNEEATKMVEEAQYEVIENGESSMALIEATDRRRGKHVEAIRDRNEMVRTQMIELAKDLLTVSMYLKRQVVTIDNCKMAVELSIGRTSLVTMYLNKVDKNDKRMNWKDIMASMARDRDKPLISSIRTIGNKKKWHLPFSKASSIQTSYLVTSGWEIDDKAFDRDFLQLLPTARMLVDEQLGQLHTETVADTEYLQVMFSETEAELGDSQ